MMEEQELTTLRNLNNPQDVVEIEHNLTETDKKPQEKPQTSSAESDEHGESCKHGHGKRGKHGPGNKNYGILVYTVFTCLSCLFLETHCFYPLLEDYSKRRILTFLSYLIVFMALWSYYQTIRTNNFLPKLKGSPLIMDIKDYIDSNFLAKQCQNCKYFKPPRVSHCSTCGGCIMKLDHHCMWTQNCIGFRNQRSFFLFTIYMTLGLLQFWTATYTIFTKIYPSCKFFSFFEPGVYILWFITCLSAFFVGIMIVGLACSHIMFVLTNHTTLMTMKLRKVCPCPICQFRNLILDDQSINPYDRGEIQNTKNLFGTNFLTGLMPFTRQPENDFVFQAPNPHPTPLQVAKFTGEYEAEMLRQQQLLKNLGQIKQLFLGRIFKINGQKVQL